jgi:hypothetical protein
LKNITKDKMKCAAVKILVADLVSSPLRCGEIERSVQRAAAATHRSKLLDTAVAERYRERADSNL